jgi:hypothetical protein
VLLLLLFHHINDRLVCQDHRELEACADPADRIFADSVLPLVGTVGYFFVAQDPGDDQPLVLLYEDRVGVRPKLCQPIFDALLPRRYSQVVVFNLGLNFWLQVLNGYLVVEVLQIGDLDNFNGLERFLSHICGHRLQWIEILFV